MATDGASCLVCGRPLTGRDRFETKCSACREAEVLGQALPPAAGARGGSPLVTCPACGVPRAADLAPCARCGASLPERPASRAGLWALVATACILGALWCVLAWRPREGPSPASWERRVFPAPAAPKAEGTAEARAATVAGQPVSGELADALRVETRELLGMLTRRDYARVIDNYVQPDEEEFRRLERALDDVVAGPSAQGFAHWAARLIRAGPARTADELARAGDPQPAFTVALVAHLAREPASSAARASLEDRARSVIQWHLAGLFEGVTPSVTEATAVAETGPGSYEIVIDLRGEREARWLRSEPASIRWCRLPAGWVIKTALAERIEGVRNVLKRSLDAAPAATP